MSEVHKMEETRARRPDLAQLVAARICHDLLSPLGAIANGVELIGLTGAPPSPELDLISESVDAATARTRFFRLAYGTAAPGSLVARAEVTSTLAAVARGGRLSFDWEAEGEQPRDEVRAAFLLLQCVESALPLGGHVVVSREGEAWHLVAEGPRLRIEEAAWAALQSSRARAPAQASLVQFALLPEALAELGRTLALKIGPDRIVARF